MAIIVIIVISILVQCSYNEQFSTNFIPLNVSKGLLDIRDETFYQFLYRISHGRLYNVSEDMHAYYKNHGSVWPPYDPKEIPPFNCSIEKPANYTKPYTVHQLTPFDINIIGAMGDSITAGFGALAFTLIDLFIEFRGISWSIGGRKDVKTFITLPNIIKKYNPSLKGYAVLDTPPLVELKVEHLDVAVSGDVATGLFQQAKRFVNVLTQNPHIYDYMGSWKVLTIFIGGNDLCSCCREFHHYKEMYNVTNYIKAIQKTLDYLHATVPKLFVNILNAPDVAKLSQMDRLKCDLTHFIECKCGTVFGKVAQAFTSQTRREYIAALTKLIRSGRYDSRDDFTVVLQLFLDETEFPRNPDGSIDYSYFAPDCFHFSGKGHASIATALWNNMLEPVGKKSISWHPGDKFKCPTPATPYFYTNLNSGK